LFGKYHIDVLIVVAECVIRVASTREVDARSIKEKCPRPWHFEFDRKTV
jgi:hypothetical protein